MRRSPTPARAAPVAMHPAPEVIAVHTRRVSCDGGGGALGHPKVFYDMGDADFVECMYCDRRFEYVGGDHDHGH